MKVIFRHFMLIHVSRLKTVRWRDKYLCGGRTVHGDWLPDWFTGKWEKIKWECFKLTKQTSGCRFLDNFDCDIKRADRREENFIHLLKAIFVFSSKLNNVRRSWHLRYSNGSFVDVNNPGQDDHSSVRVISHQDANEECLMTDY